MAIKIKKILEAGLVVYPATIIDAVKDAKSVKVEGVETNKWYGKTLREILEDLDSSADIKTLEDKLYTGTPAQGTEGEEGYVPAVDGDIPAIKARLDVIEGEGEGSIKKAASDAVAEVVDNAPEAFNTLKEIAEWIAKDTNADAFDAAQRIANLETAVGAPASGEDEEATGLYKAIADATATSALGEVGLTLGEDGKWVEGTANEATGLATAADVAVELVNDEKVIAAALNDHEARIAAIENAEGFSTEDLSDADAAAVDYEDVF